MQQQLSKKEFWEIGEYIQAELNSFEFFGIRIGSTLANFFIDKYLSGRYEIDVKESLRNKASIFIRETLLTPVNRHVTVNFNKKIVIGLAGCSDRLYKMVLPFCENEADKLHFVIQNDAGIDRFPKEYPYLFYLGLTAIENKQWKTAFSKISKKLRNKIKELVNRKGLPGTLTDEIYLTLILQTQKLLFFYNQFQSQRPVVVLVLSDRMSLATILVLVAQRLNIPNYTFIHGSTNPPEPFLPFIADTVLCWGELQKRQFINLGVAPDKLVLVGNPKLTRDVNISKLKICDRLQIGKDVPVILLATNNIESSQRYKYAEAFCQAAKQLGNVTGIIKLHPTEYVAEYTDIQSNFPFIHILDDKLLDFESSFAVADIVVSHNSGYGFDALVKNKIVIILDNIDYELGIGLELVEQAGCPRVTNAQELKETIEHLLKAPDYLSSVIASKEYYVKQMIYAFGEDATKNLCRTILN